MLATIQTIDIKNSIARINFSDGGYTELGVAYPPVVPAPNPVPATAVIRGGYFDSIPDDQAKTYADAFGMSYVRLWHTIKWGEALTPTHPTFVRCRKLQAQGLKTLVVMTPPESTGAPPDASGTAYTYFDNAAHAAVGCVDAWEVWNEPNLVNYNSSYPTAASLWIRNGLLPAYTALKKLNQFVVSGGWSEGPNNGFDYAVSSGLLKFCDAVGYHPYGQNANDQIARVQKVRSMIGNKPLWLTEWNLHMNGLPTWADELIAAAKGIAPLVQAVIHFRMVRTTQAAGFAAPYTLDGNTLLPTAGFNSKLITAMQVFA